jgi:poly-gamma-glutamate synthesis protein (capsule biosynthesis protein)
VRNARENADVLIFTAHWGPNMRSQPTPEFRDFARAVIDAGADIFWGHSAHVVQGIEVWNNKPILYDTGDFVDDYAVDGKLRNDLSALFQITVKPPVVLGVSHQPVRIDGMQVRLCDGEDRAWFTDRIRRLCTEMGTIVTERDGELFIPVTPQGHGAGGET